MTPMPNPKSPHIQEFLKQTYYQYRWDALSPEHREQARQHWLTGFSGFVPAIDHPDITAAGHKLRYLKAAYSECLDQAPMDFPPEHPLRAALEQLEQAATLADQASATVKEYLPDIPRIGEVI